MKPFLELKNLSVGYAEPLIIGVNAHLSLGEVCLLVGNNGIGKTTLMRSVLSQNPLLEGEILLEGKKVSEMAPLDIAKRIAVVFSKPTIPEHYTLIDLLSLGRYVHHSHYFRLDEKDKENIEKAMEMLHLQQYKNFPLKKLSDGNLQKAFIGRALVQDTPMILLDEPTTYLDEENKIMILKQLHKIAKEQNKAILFSSHDWRLARHFADKVWEVKSKRINELSPNSYNPYPEYGFYEK